MDDQLDPAMLEQIDLLLDMEVLEQEEEWPLIDDIESAEQEDPGEES